MSSLVPYLLVRNAAAAIDFYQKAFGAEEHFRMPAPDGKSIMHAELQIGDGLLYLADEFPERGLKSPQTLGGSPVTIHINSPDVDATFAAAVAAGATAIMPPADMFWGDRHARLTDPFGHSWSISTARRKLTAEEMNAAASEFFSKSPSK